MPRYPSQTATKTARLRDGIGAEVVQLHSVVLAQSPHEPAYGDAEASLVEPHEAHDVALRGLRLGLLRKRGNPRRRPRIGDPRQQPVGDQLLQDRHCGGGLPPWQRLLDVRHFFNSRGNVGAKALGWLRCSLSLSLFLLPPFRSWLRVQDAREAEKAERDEGKWPGEPKQPIPLRFISPRRAQPQPQPKPTTLNAVDFAITDGWAPRPRSLPRAHAAITAAR